MVAAGFWLGVGAGVGASVAAFGAAWVYFRSVVRSRRNAPSPPDPPTPAPTDPPRPIGNGVAPIASPVAAVAALPPEAAPGAPPRDAAPAASLVRLSQRILVHLAHHGPRGAEGSVDEAATQRGIGGALGATQGALSSVLRRLEDGGAITSEKLHVRGRSRRVKVYRLTPRGVELARRAAAVARPATAPADRRAPGRGQ